LSDGGQGYAIAGSDRMQRAVRIDLSAAAFDENLPADNFRGYRARVGTSSTCKRPLPVKILPCCSSAGGGSSAGISVLSGSERNANLAPVTAALSRAPAGASEEANANTSKAHHDAAVPNRM